MAAISSFSLQGHDSHHDVLLITEPECRAGSVIRTIGSPTKVKNLLNGERSAVYCTRRRCASIFRVRIISINCPPTNPNQLTTPPPRENNLAMASKSFYAVIAGVGPGTGRSVALRFARAYPVVLLARKPESYSGIVSEIRQQGGEAVGISADTSDAQSVASAFESIRKELPDKKLAAAICESHASTIA